MTLADIILERIPPAMLERVVHDQGVLGEKEFRDLFKASGLPPAEIAQKVVDAYGKNAPLLAFGLYQQTNETEWQTAKELYAHFNQCAELQYDSLQASLVGRYPTLPIEGLSEFLRSVKRQVCLIVSRKGTRPLVRGTGFLVGPDLVLTCRHVLRDFVPGDDVKGNENRIEIYFDFFHGNPIDDIASNPPGATRLQPDRAWHVASCEAAYPDGRVVELPAERMAQLSRALDFILLRLETSVGLQPVDKGGGYRRGWVKIPAPAANVPPPDEWIIIPQHPNGYSQRIDLGRLYQIDETGTRLRYNTNTARGSSGAPCFDHEFSLVGIHNAQVGPGEKPWANEAIWFAKIAETVRQHLQQAPNPPEYALRWSVAAPGEHSRVILGREKALNWLKDSTSPAPRNLADRVYAAQADDSGAGCSFSIDLLEAELRGSRIPRAVYGKRGQQLPASTEDFLLSLLRELGIKLDANETIPPRPSSSNVITGEIDKLDRWLADELPSWLGDMIVKHTEKQIDIRAEARQVLQRYYAGREADAPEEIRTHAAARDPIYKQQIEWDYAYIVIDDLRGTNYRGSGARTDLKGEIRSLVAALVQGKSEQLLHPGLRRLRWMFLGYLPDFVSANPLDSNGVSLEVLDPGATSPDEVLSVFHRMAEAYVVIRETPQRMLEAVAQGLIKVAETASEPATRLCGLQRLVNIMADEMITTST